MLAARAQAAGLAQPADVWVPSRGLHGPAAFDLAVTAAMRPANAKKNIECNSNGNVVAIMNVIVIDAVIAEAIVIVVIVAVLLFIVTGREIIIIMVLHLVVIARI